MYDVGTSENAVKEYMVRGTWAKLKPVARKKISAAFKTVPDETVTEWIKEFETAKAAGDPAASSRSPNTTIDDRARAAHMLADPRMRSIFTRCYSVLTREELDDKERATGPWDEAAVEYNDYDGNVYSNILVKSRPPFVDGVRSPPTNPPERAVYPGRDLSSAFTSCKNIDPSASHRPIRDGPWLKNCIAVIRADFTKPYEKFKLSGQHDAEDIVDEFTKFHKGDVLVLYLFCLFGCGNIDSVQSLLGKVLVPAAAQESGVLQDGKEKTPPSATHSLGKKGKNEKGGDKGDNTRQIILSVKKGEESKISGVLAEEKDETDFSLQLIAAKDGLPSPVVKEAITSLAEVQQAKKRRRLSRDAAAASAAALSEEV
jgi:hypothetical protein